MAKRLIPVLLSAALCAGANAAYISPADALTRALGGDIKAPASRSAAPMTLDRTFRSASGAPAVYLFRSSGAAMLLPADDLAEPVLGYFDNAPEGAMPPQLEWWISEYARQIAWAAEHPAAVSRNLSTDADTREPVAPLLTTVWNQSTPFNDNCPFDGDRRAPTGCLATALAQIMNYWEYPAEPTGAITYTDSYGHVRSCTFDDKPFIWADMADDYNADDNGSVSYTPAQASAVAWLMEAAGHATQMKYSAMGSGAYTFNLAPAISRYFGYTGPVTMLQRDYYSAEVWENLVYDHIRTVGPVFYTGANFNNMGHAFVCDGYQGNGYFHINWGWGGLYDGYFRLSALTPDGYGIGGYDGGFNYLQDAVFNIAPPGEPTLSIPEESPITLAGNLTMLYHTNKELHLTSDEQAYRPGMFYNAGNSTLNVEVGLRAVNTATLDTHYLIGYTGTLAPRQGVKELVVAVNTLPAGTYKATIVVKVADGDWSPLAHPASAIDYTNLTIGTNGSISAETPVTAEMTVDPLNVETDLYWGTPYRISFTVSTKSSIKIEETVQPMLYTDSYDLATMFARGENIAISLDKPGSKDFRVITSMQVYSSSAYTGSAYLGLVSLGTGLVLHEQPVNVGARPAAPQLELGGFVFKGNADNADPAALQFDCAIKCTDGYYVGPISVYLYKENESDPSSLALAAQFNSTETCFLHAGEQAAESITCSLNSAVAGEKYRAILGYVDRNGTMVPLNGDNPVMLTIHGKETDGIDAVSADPAAPEAVIHDLTGRRLRRADAAGIYIVNGAKVLVR